MRFPVTLLSALSIAAVIGTVPARTQQTDLDAFMERVLARRDENWRKLQQYVLDEREIAELRGPGGTRLFGMDREYTWYIRDGVFVRSPVRFDGLALDEETRREYERKWIDREREHARKDEQTEPSDTASAANGKGERKPLSDADGQALLTELREPRFVSAAYFLKFKFESGRYGLVGPDTYEGQRVLRIEYYPTRLYGDDDDRDEKDERPPEKAPGDDQESRLERQFNKVALITLWVEPEGHQIVKYTFENLDFDFLPGRWLARLENVHATMQMHQPFAGVWLPRGIEGRAAVTFASGTYEVRYDVRYENYREAEVKARVR